MFSVFADVPQTSDWLALFCCGFVFGFLSDAPEAERERKEEARGEWALYAHQRRAKQKRSGYRAGVAGRARQTTTKKAHNTQGKTKTNNKTKNGDQHVTRARTEGRITAPDRETRRLKRTTLLRKRRHKE